ncbi:complement receptor type 2-like isoform X2 [Apostichopus japonicus]
MNTCLNGGTWQFPPSTCEIFNCGKPPLGDALNVIPDKEIYNARETITYTCNQGYTLTGAGTATCDDEDVWNPATVPICIASCESPNILNGNLTTNGPFNNGDSAQVNCYDGSDLESGASTTITCQSDGTWDEVPSCFRRCNVNPVPNSNSATSSTFSHGGTKTITCNGGYSYEQQITFTLTCSDSTVGGTVPDQCYMDCNPPIIAPENGEITGGNLHGESVQFSCDRGYGINGTATDTCDNGVWENGGTPPTCYEFTCTLPEISDEDLSLEPNKAVYNGSEVIEYSCPDDMMLVGNSNSTCVDQDLWDMTPPTCESVQVSTCTAPAVTDDGLRFEPSKDSYSIGETITYSCDGDLELKGTVSATCEDENEWNPPSLPICSSGHVHRVAILLISISVFIPKYFT